MHSPNFLFLRFLVFPPANPSNVSHCKCFLFRYNFIYQVNNVLLTFVLFCCIPLHKKKFKEKIPVVVGVFPSFNFRVDCIEKCEILHQFLTIIQLTQGMTSPSPLGSMATESRLPSIWPPVRLSQCSMTTLSPCCPPTHSPVSPLLREGVTVWGLKVALHITLKQP